MDRSEIQVREIEKNVILLLNKLKDNYLLIQSLKSKLKELESSNLNFNEDITALKQKNKSLSMANSLLGSDENKDETKNKINLLIKEINTCINQLKSSS
tara:strand:- start:19 stop:315 length:297 start_codon:yes stop_codon:yes gene_type:complete